MRLSMVLGATPRSDLRALIVRRGLRTNAYFETLWPHVIVADAPRPLDVIVTTAADLGLAEPLTLDELVAYVAPHGLGPCPLEAAVWLALALDEPAGSGRITVVSSRPLPDQTSPRGFYWRHDGEGRWLRAFVATDDWRFAVEERFALAVVRQGGAGGAPGP